ncbi:MAG: hypothetical protein PVI41_00885 [Roseobacter sp.]|jgi:hypothetical protein
MFVVGYSTRRPQDFDEMPGNPREKNGFAIVHIGLIVLENSANRKSYRKIRTNSLKIAVEQAQFAKRHFFRTVSCQFGRSRRSTEFSNAIGPEGTLVIMVSLNARVGTMQQSFSYKNKNLTVPALKPV